MRFNSTSCGPQAPPAEGSTAEASLGVGDFHDLTEVGPSCIRVYSATIDALSASKYLHVEHRV